MGVGELKGMERPIERREEKRRRVNWIGVRCEVCELAGVESGVGWGRFPRGETNCLVVPEKGWTVQQSTEHSTEQSTLLCKTEMDYS